MKIINNLTDTSLPSKLFLICFSFDLHEDVVIPCRTLNDINDYLEKFCMENPYLIDKEMKYCRIIQYSFTDNQKRELETITSFLTDYSFRMIGRVNMNTYPYHFEIREFYPQKQKQYHKSDFYDKSIKFIW